MAVDITSIVAEVEDFPTLPTIYTSLLELMANPRTTVHQLADMVATDPACALKLLKTVNSSMYRVQGRVNSISEAIFHVGFNEVKQLVTAITVVNTLTGQASTMTSSIVDLWKHSLGVGVIAKILAASTNDRNGGHHYTNGLLHDIGKLFFMRAYPKEYVSLLKEVNEQNGLIVEAEKRQFGMDHTEVGELLARRWRLPESLCTTIRHHEEGTVNGQFNRDVAIIHVADIAARMLELGNGGVRVVPRPTFEVWAGLGIPPKTFSQMREVIVRDYEQAVSVMLEK
ncbi:MAG: HDOD domain-containing protein [Candidatus Kapaibacterium sp.]